MRSNSGDFDHVTDLLVGFVVCYTLLLLKTLM